MEWTASEVATARARLKAREKQHDQDRERARQRVREKARAAARSILPRFPQVRRAYLFGSVVRPGMMRRDSDIDIAVEGCLGAEDYFALWRDLERAVAERDVELVDLDRDVHFAARVRETGEMIYEREN